MNSFVKALYYGEVSPWERSRSKDPEYIRMGHKINDIQKHFQNTLPAEEWERIEELGSLYARSLSIENAEVFSYGLNMGMMLMADALDFKDKIEQDG